VRSARTLDRANEWALVLLSAGLSPQVRGQGGAFLLRLPESDRERAQAALEAYERENPSRVAESAATPDPPSVLGFGVGSAWLVFFLTTGPYGAANPWFEAGRASASAILGGEAWRTVTALTLHVDVLHVLGNALLGALLVNAVGSLLGPGVGLAAVLASGIVGNGVNAALQPPFHSSVGGSTAVFGALGVLCSLAWLQRRRRGIAGRRLWLPLAAGLGLIAMVGVGGPRTDLWAHLFGFLAGAAIGPLTASRKRARPSVQLASLLLALGIVAGAWLRALATG